MLHATSSNVCENLYTIEVFDDLFESQMKEEIVFTIDSCGSSMQKCESETIYINENIGAVDSRLIKEGISVPLRESDTLTNEKEKVLMEFTVIQRGQRTHCVICQSILSSGAATSLSYLERSSCGQRLVQLLYKIIEKDSAFCVSNMSRES